MTHLTREESLALATPGTGFRVSVYLPLAATFPDANQNPVRVRNALDDAERLLIERGLSASEACALLEEARSSAITQSSQRGAAGLALLMEQGRTKTCFLPYSCRAETDIGPSFRLAPLMRLSNWPMEFRLLSLSANTVELFRCTRTEMTPVELSEAVPRSLDAFLSGTQFGQPVRFQTAWARDRAGRRSASCMAGPASRMTRGPSAASTSTPSRKRSRR